MLRGFLGAELDALAAKSKSNRAAALALVGGAATLDDYPMLQSIEGHFPEGERTLVRKEADKARQTRELTLFGRAWLEKLAQPLHDWMEGRRRVGTFVEHRDRPALRAYLKDGSNGITDRLEAAQELALLGDATGLMLWDTSEGLWPEERADRRALLVHISHDAPAEIRTQAEALLAKSWPP